MSTAHNERERGSLTRMTTLQSILYLFLAAVGGLTLAACSRADKDNASTVAQDLKATAVDAWTGIKDFTYEKRVEFCASVDRMSKNLDEKTADLKVQAAKTSDASAKDRQAALKEYDEAQADLKVKLDELKNASANTWADAKAQVAAAWKRVEAAYDKASK